MPRLGYLLPTRERVMEGQDETGSLLALAERAEKLGFDSLWVGDSLLARPRHDPRSSCRYFTTARLLVFWMLTAINWTIFRKRIPMASAGS